MSTRFLIGIAIAFALVLVGGVAAVVSATSLTDRVAVVSDSTAKPSAPAPVVSGDPVAESLPNPPALAPAPAPVATPDSSQPVTVADSDLADLAASVKLGQTSTGDVGKDVWAREVPIAQKLLNGMCDCDQRNWLKHFVQTGQEAMAGSNHFPDSVQVLTKLRRSDTDLTSAQAAR